MDEVSRHLDLVRLLFLEERDHIANIRSGAAAGNHVAKASMETIAIKENKLEQIKALGEFLRGLYNAGQGEDTSEDHPK